MALTPQMEKLLAEAPPLTARQRDLIAACFAGGDLDAPDDENPSPRVKSHQAEGDSH